MIASFIFISQEWHFDEIVGYVSNYDLWPVLPFIRLCSTFISWKKTFW